MSVHNPRESTGLYALTAMLKYNLSYDAALLIDKYENLTETFIQWLTEKPSRYHECEESIDLFFDKCWKKLSPSEISKVSRLYLKGKSFPESAAKYVEIKDLSKLKMLLKRASADEIKMLNAHKYSNNDSLLHLIAKEDLTLDDDILSYFKDLNELYKANDQGDTPIHIAISNSPACFHSIWKGCPIKTACLHANKDGNTPLHLGVLASSHGAINIIVILREFLENKEQMNNLFLQNREGNTPFHLASSPTLMNQLWLYAPNEVRKMAFLNNNKGVNSLHRGIQIDICLAFFFRLWNEYNEKETFLQQEELLLSDYLWQFSFDELEKYFQKNNDFHNKFENILNEKRQEVEKHMANILAKAKPKDKQGEAEIQQLVIFALKELKENSLVTFKKDNIDYFAYKKYGNLKIVKAEKNLGKGGIGTVDLWRKIHSTGFIVSKKSKKRQLDYIIHREVDVLLDIHRLPNVPPSIQKEPKFIMNNKKFIFQYGSHFYPGGNASDVISRGGLKGEELSKCMDQLLKGLEFLHTNDFVHLDIKSDNIFIDKDGTYVLADFGGGHLSHIKKSSGTHSVTYTLPSDLFAIQEAENESCIYDLQKKRDIYSLGLVFFQLATACDWDELDGFIRKYVPQKPQNNIDGGYERFSEAIRQKLTEKNVEHGHSLTILCMVDPNIERRVSTHVLSKLCKMIGDK